MRVRVLKPEDPQNLDSASSFTYIGAFRIAFCAFDRCLTDSEYLRGEFEEIVYDAAFVRLYAGLCGIVRNHANLLASSKFSQFDGRLVTHY